jgi:hypothetical protein
MEKGKDKRFSKMNSLIKLIEAKLFHKDFKRRKHPWEWFE